MNGPLTMTKDECVDYVIRMMLRGEWQGMKSRAELSEKWKCHERTIGDYASIASGFLSRAGGDLVREAQEALAELDNVKKMALSYEAVYYDKNGEAHVAPQPKLREATEAIKLKMDILGITSKRSDRNQRPPKDVDDKYASATREERIAMLKQALAEEEMAASDRERLQ